ncbi:MAG: Microtubule-nucleating Tub4p (gamma-tubulin) complex component [Pleopsidium flavum]|nr:MAG: Microtubule-nucleating Tub4p (gamma-tubulin) complex component [Pleopsidium flavum]
MADEKAQRIHDALSSLVDALIPTIPDEDEADADERHDNAVDLARSILDSRDGPAVVSDVNHASDLIKKKLLRENASPDKAVRFSNLYSRLLTQPVLSQKWAILYLLHQLSDSSLEPRPSDGSPGQQHVSEILSLREASAPPRSAGLGQNDGAGSTIDEAFSSTGLPRLPVRGSEQRDGQGINDKLGEVYGRGRAKKSDVPDKGEVLANRDYSVQPPETALLRDLPFTLQGLSSTNLQFSSAPTLTLPPTLPLPLISLLHTLAEPSLLYRGLSEYIQSPEGGLIGQSLKAAIGQELRSYLGLVATLEGEIRRALASLGDGEPRGGIGTAGVTLKRCVIWTREATMGLRLISLMVEESKTRRGGQLISMIHGFSSSHGDPFVGAFAERLLSSVTRPFYDMLRQWIYDGELSDPYHEFFVIEQDARANGEVNDPRRIAATSVWEDKYKLDDDMIPSIITQHFAKKVFLIGKSLNFIRYGCGDSAWVEAYSKEASKELRYGDTATLETSIDEAYKTTMARLIHLMDYKFKLFEHLRALKKYILLGQGDFIALLMESLASNLDRPANSQYRHTLTAQLEHAIRASNAQYDSPDVLRRLDARLLELSHGDIGWDLFTLEYKIDAPVDVVITPWATTQYLKVFNFLWRVKRVEFALGSTWRRCMTGARGVLASVDDKMGRDWKVARCCMAEMIHFVCQLQYYILFEVIEASWDQLQIAIGKPGCTLDDLIEAHTKYLNSITHKGLLGSARTSSSGHREDDFMQQLHRILKLMLAYKDAVDGLYSFSVAEFTRRQEFNAKIETRTAQGKWGITEKDDDELRSPSPSTMARGRGAGRDGTDSPFPAADAGTLENSEDHMLPALRQRLRDLSSDFTSKLNVLLGDLAYQPDVDMRFLGVVMNFNDVYHPVKRKRKEHRSDRDKKTPKPSGGGSSVDGDVAGKGAAQKGER